MPRRKILSAADIALRIERQRQRGAAIVLTTGCFDILHVGHVRLLAAARKLGDCLVVGVNSDATVRALKGSHRPVNEAKDRCEVLAALQAVDFVCVFSEATPAELILRLRPSVFVKGGDYTLDRLPELSAVHEVGAALRLVPFQGGYSTSSILARGSCSPV